MATAQQPKCKNLVLDAGPLLSLSPLRGLAETYFTVPQVLSELKDPRAREHFEKLGLLSGVKVEVRSPDASSLSHGGQSVIQWAKKTGDYSVLSHPDLCVLALTYLLDQEDQKRKEKEIVNESQTSNAEENAESKSSTEPTTEPTPHEATVTLEEISEQLNQTTLENGDKSHDEPSIESGAVEETEVVEEQNLEPLDVELLPVEESETRASQPEASSSRQGSPPPIFEDPSDSDDGEGEWITPDNVNVHKSRALDMLPDSGLAGKGKKGGTIGSGCMTADFAMQNVLLQMGLNLVGLEGKRIEKVKNWVLRCHACFKICKDNSKKFCPSCGNPTLLRASVTVAAPNASANAPAMQVHLKPNFQYKTRGTIYSIPNPKPGSAKTGPGTGLILREDQIEYMRAKKRADTKHQREEERLRKGILDRGVENRGSTSSWMDPDWIPEILSAGTGGKGRTMHRSGMDGDMPQIGYGRKNPNEKRRKK